MIVCYQFRVKSFSDKFKPFNVFAKDMDDFHAKVVIGVGSICEAVCGWRIKQK